MNQPRAFDDVVVARRGEWLHAFPASGARSLEIRLLGALAVVSARDILRRYITQARAEPGGAPPRRVSAAGVGVTSSGAAITCGRELASPWVRPALACVPWRRWRPWPLWPAMAAYPESDVEPARVESSAPGRPPGANSGHRRAESLNSSATCTRMRVELSIASWPIGHQWNISSTSNNSFSTG